MKKLLLGSAALTLFSISIILFQISCKKEATAQTTSNNCIDAGIVNFTVNFPQGFNLSSTDFESNRVSLSNFYSRVNPHAAYFLDFREVGSTKLKIITFKSVVPGTYKWDIELYSDISSHYIYNKSGSTSFTLVVAAGQTYNITVNAEDFKPA